MNKKVSAITALTICLLTQAMNSQAATQDSDPLEPFNRVVFTFNESLDRWILKPVSKGYVSVTPEPVRNSIGRFFFNLSEPITTINDLLQLKPGKAAVSSCRFVVNSTIGVLGFFDVAVDMGLEKHQEDLGQSLGYWGVPSGPYLVLPVFGPSNVRDTAGFVGDVYTDPLTWYPEDRVANYSLRGLEFVQIRAELLEVEHMLKGDRYSAMRDLYMQTREYDVKDGDVEDEFTSEPVPESGDEESQFLDEELLF